MHPIQFQNKDVSKIFLTRFALLQFTLLYEVKEGSSNQSFGLEVARLAGFPLQVLDDAKCFLEKSEMPLLRQHSKSLSSADVTNFLATYAEAEASGNKKRKKELVDDMKAKVFKIVD